MSTPSQTLIDLENKFWNSLVDQDADTALEMLTEPSLLVNAHGAMRVDHATYRKMADEGPLVLTSFELSDMQVVFPNDSTAVLTYRVRQEVAKRGERKGDIQEMNDASTWVKTNGEWRCAMHTETPARSAGKTQ
jgi:hypothetical protein